jgi:uncharacterized protein YkwD
MRWVSIDVDTSSMRDSRLGSVLRSAARLALAGLVVALANGATPALASSPACPAADTATAETWRLEKAVLCLHNLERRERGLSQLRWNRQLAHAAERHATDMVSRQYFAHASPGGRDHMDRIAATGYAPAVGCWTAGENLFFSTGSSTPRQLLRAWMNSPAHRANILRGGWQGFGLGVAATSPQGDAHGLTVVALFGTRSKQACA